MLVNKIFILKEKKYIDRRTVKTVLLDLSSSKHILKLDDGSYKQENILGIEEARCLVNSLITKLTKGIK